MSTASMYVAPTGGQSKTARVQSVFDHRRSAMSYRPGVVPGHEMNDTEFEEDGSDLDEFSGRRSEDSAGKSSATLSSVDEAPTPDTQNNEFGGFNFDLSGDILAAKAVQGPTGPHLFRVSTTSSSQDFDYHMSMSPPHSPEEIRSAKETRSPTSRTRSSRPKSPPQPPIEGQSPPTSVPLRTWTPMQVAEWMHAIGFEHTIVETFFINDISGVTLIDLHYEDLKELGITSFGQRHRLWNEIRALKEDKLADGFEDELVFEEPPRSPPLEELPELPRVVACSSPATPEDDEAKSPGSARRRRRKTSGNDVVLPAESASIVAIEQLLPKPHKCSKGENCAKYQKQQRKLARIVAEFPVEMSQIANAQAHSPTNSGFAAASVFAPSIVASSDALGKAQPAVRLEEDNLKTVQSRDPQENVRQFLTFQHFNQEKPLEPESPPYEMFPPLSPPKSQAPHQHLSSLPKLTIPLAPVYGVPTKDTDRTARPSDYRQRYVASPLHAFDLNYQPVAHDTWRIASPASEMDVPVTAIPLGPIERDVSSSVPPDMRYGGAALASPISRSSSRAAHREGPPPAFHMPSGAMSPIARSKSVNQSRRMPSMTTAPPVLREETAAEAALMEQDSPTEIEADGDVTPTATRPGGRSSSEEARHDGWMKKRRTRMLRHEWQEAHFRLRGTQLAMHADERAVAALEYIDVDDYAVAVSGAAADSKLNAAMRRLHLNSKRAQLDPHAFAFQLTPAAERKGLRHAATGKTHHFAVRTATERIDWMRELMLARARKEKGVDIASFD